MSEHQTSIPAQTRFVQLTPGLAGVVALVALLLLAKSVVSILILFFLAVLLSVYLDSVRDLFVSKLKMSEKWGFVAAVVISVLILWGIWALLVPPVVAQTRLLISRIPEMATNWKGQLSLLLVRYPFMEPYIGPESQTELIGAALAEAERFLGGLLPKVFELVHVFINIVSVMVMGIFLTLHPETYEGILVSVTPPRFRGATHEVLRALSSTLRSWVMAQLLAMTVLGVLTAVLFWAVGVPYWLAFGLFAGLAAIVPFFGTLASTIVPALFVLGGDGGTSAAIVVLVIGIVVHVVEANLIAPLIMHHGVKLPPVFSIMAVLIVGSVLGPVGLLVAVPMLAVMMVLVKKILIEHIYREQLIYPAA